MSARHSPRCAPGFFIPLAEELGLIISMGEWILRAACRDARRWQVMFDLPLRIGGNLSPLQLRQPSLVQIVDAVLKETGLDPRLLDLEVTESISQIDSEPTRNAARLARARLWHLDRRLWHRAVVARLHQAVSGRPDQDRPGVRAQYRRRSRRRGHRPHDLNREVVAEGVEIEQHLDFPRGEGCEVLQGFLFCRPLPAASFENLLAERARLLGSVAESPAAQA